MRNCENCCAKIDRSNTKLGCLSCARERVRDCPSVAFHFRFDNTSSVMMCRRVIVSRGIPTTTGNKCAVEQALLPILSRSVFVCVYVYLVSRPRLNPRLTGSSSRGSRRRRRLHRSVVRAASNEQLLRLSGSGSRAAPSVSQVECYLLRRNMSDVQSVGQIMARAIDLSSTHTR